MGGDFDKSQLSQYVDGTDLVIFDIGCYDGSDSVEFAETYPKAKVYSFEPDSRSIELFKSKVNNDRITLVETAISNVDGEIEWFGSDSDTRRHYEDQTSWSASSSMKRPKKHIDTFTDVYFNDITKVKSTKLDTWCEENGIDKIDIMWVDVNGAVKEFIEGAKNTLKNKTKLLITEFEEIELYEGSSNLDETLELLPNFEKVEVFNFLGNFGNVILKNKNI